MVQPARLSGRSVQKQNRSYRITRYYYGGAPARSRATTSPPDAQLIDGITFAKKITQHSTPLTLVGGGTR